MDHSFKKHERLCHKKIIESLFDRSDTLNKSRGDFPLRVIYRRADESEASRVLFSVPKRLLKRAVDRNLVKRRLREAYRLNKHLIVGKPSYIVFLYLSKEKATFCEVERSMLRLLSKINPY